VGLSCLQQGGPSVVVASLVSGSWEREVILRDWGRVSKHANESLSTSHFQILKHLKGEGETFRTGRFHSRSLSLGQESRTAMSLPLSSFSLASGCG
jgi:hypothetical protein